MSDRSNKDYSSAHEFWKSSLAKKEFRDYFGRGIPNLATAALEGYVAGDSGLKAINLARYAVNMAKLVDNPKYTLDSGYISALESLGEFPYANRELKNPEAASFENVLAKIREYPTRQLEMDRIDIDESRGFMVPAHLFDVNNPNFDHILFFQYNPSEWDDTKRIGLTERNYVGYGANKEIFGYGGRRSISFELFFDASQLTIDYDALYTDDMRRAQSARWASDADKHAKYGGTTEEGTFNVVSKLESYMYPAITLEELESLGVARYTNGLFESAPRFESIPIVYFVFGNQFYQGRVQSVQTKHLLFGKRGVPKRTRCSVVFLVDEWGIYGDIGADVKEAVSRAINYLKVPTNTSSVNVNQQELNQIGTVS